MLISIKPNRATRNTTGLITLISSWSSAVSEVVELSASHRVRYAINAR
jgi:hypothetical protein